MIRKIFIFGVLALTYDSQPLAAAADGAVHSAHRARAASAGLEVRAIELNSAADAAQVTFSLTGAAHERVSRLTAPSRVVVDLAGTRLGRGVRPPAGSGLVGSIRTGARPAGGLRIVIELNTATVSRVHWLDSPRGGAHRLLVDLGSGTISPAANLAPDEVPQPLRAAHAPADADRAIVIAVDAGHGGQDPGATGHGGTHEKDVTLAIARALAARIDSEAGMRAVLTRNRDEFLTLRERIRRARVAKADMFVSIHADSIRNEDVSGASVYVLSERGATDETARWLAERENAADLIGGVSLDDKNPVLASVLLDLSQSANISASMTAAQRVLAALDGVGVIRKEQIQQAGFVVLKSPDIPSMLIETAYISNPADERRLRSQPEQDKLAAAIFSGVRGYFDGHPPLGTSFAQLRRPKMAAVVEGPPRP